MSFLRDYLAYSTNNEAPEMFHVWGAYSCLAAAVGRKVWLPDGPEVYYPNIYVMYIGDAGNGKTVALKMVKRMIALLGDKGEPVHVSRSVETPEGLTFYMAGNPHAEPPVPSPVMKLVRWPHGEVLPSYPMFIIANEFINFISKNMEGWTALLNDIYDEDKYEYRTKNKGEDNLIGPYICLLGALTTEVSSDLQKARIISTGFARRTLFQYGERKWHEPHAFRTKKPGEEEAQKRALDWLKQVQKLAGEFTWSEDAKAYYENWYNAQIMEVPKKPQQIKSWFASKPNQVLKIAMLTAMSENLDLRLETSHLEVALHYLGVMEEDLMKVFGGVGRNELASIAMAIVTFLQQVKDPWTKSKLKAQFFLHCKPPNDFDSCIEYLVSSDQIKVIGVEVKGKVTEVIGTPEAIDRLVASLKRPEPPASTASESPSGPAPAAGPSSAPPSGPSGVSPSNPTAAPPPDETPDDPPHSADPDQDET
jgi:hypothetical protein